MEDELETELSRLMGRSRGVVELSSEKAETFDKKRELIADLQKYYETNFNRFNKEQARRCFDVLIPLMGKKPATRIQKMEHRAALAMVEAENVLLSAVCRMFLFGEMFSDYAGRICGFLQEILWRGGESTVIIAGRGISEITQCREDRNPKDINEMYDFSVSLLDSFSEIIGKRREPGEVVLGRDSMEVLGEMPRYLLSILWNEKDIERTNGVIERMLKIFFVDPGAYDADERTLKGIWELKKKYLSLFARFTEQYRVVVSEHRKPLVKAMLGLLDQYDERSVTLRRDIFECLKLLIRAFKEEDIEPYIDVLLSEKMVGKGFCGQQMLRVYQTKTALLLMEVASVRGSAARRKRVLQICLGGVIPDETLGIFVGVIGKSVFEVLCAGGGQKASGSEYELVLEGLCGMTLFLEAMGIRKAAPVGVEKLFLGDHTKKKQYSYVLHRVMEGVGMFFHNGLSSGICRSMSFVALVAKMFSVLLKQLETLLVVEREAEFEISSHSADIFFNKFVDIFSVLSEEDFLFVAGKNMKSFIERAKRVEAMQNIIRFYREGKSQSVGFFSVLFEGLITDIAENGITAGAVQLFEKCFSAHKTGTSLLEPIVCRLLPSLMDVLLGCRQSAPERYCAVARVVFSYVHARESAVLGEILGEYEAVVLEDMDEMFVEDPTEEKERELNGEIAAVFLVLPLREKTKHFKYIVRGIVAGMEAKETTVVDALRVWSRVATMFSWDMFVEAAGESAVRARKALLTLSKTQPQGLAEIATRIVLRIGVSMGEFIKHSGPVSGMHLPGCPLETGRIVSRTADLFYDFCIAPEEREHGLLVLCEWVRMCLSGSVEEREELSPAEQVIYTMDNVLHTGRTDRRAKRGLLEKSLDAIFKATDHMALRGRGRDFLWEVYGAEEENTPEIESSLFCCLSRQLRRERGREGTAQTLVARMAEERGKRAAEKRVGNAIEHMCGTVRLKEEKAFCSFIDLLPGLGLSFPRREVIRVLVWMSTHCKEHAVVQLKRFWTDNREVYSSVLEEWRGSVGEAVIADAIGGRADSLCKKLREERESVSEGLLRTAVLCLRHGGGVKNDRKAREEVISAVEMRPVFSLQCVEIIDELPVAVDGDSARVCKILVRALQNGVVARRAVEKMQEIVEWNCAVMDELFPEIILGLNRMREDTILALLSGVGPFLQKDMLLSFIGVLKSGRYAEAVSFRLRCILGFPNGMFDRVELKEILKSVILPDYVTHSRFLYEIATWFGDEIVLNENTSGMSVFTYADRLVSGRASEVASSVYSRLHPAERYVFYVVVGDRGACPSEFLPDSHGCSFGCRELRSIFPGTTAGFDLLSASEMDTEQCCRVVSGASSLSLDGETSVLVHVVRSVMKGHADTRVVDCFAEKTRWRESETVLIYLLFLARWCGNTALVEKAMREGGNVTEFVRDVFGGTAAATDQPALRHEYDVCHLCCCLHSSAVTCYQTDEERVFQNLKQQSLKPIEKGLLSYRKLPTQKTILSIPRKNFFCFFEKCINIETSQLYKSALFFVAFRMAVRDIVDENPEREKSKSAVLAEIRKDPVSEVVLWQDGGMCLLTSGVLKQNSFPEFLFFVGSVLLLREEGSLSFSEEKTFSVIENLCVREGSSVNIYSLVPFLQAAVKHSQRDVLASVERNALGGELFFVSCAFVNAAKNTEYVTDYPSFLLLLGSFLSSCSTETKLAQVEGSLVAMFIDALFGLPEAHPALVMNLSSAIGRCADIACAAFFVVEKHIFSPGLLTTDQKEELLLLLSYYHRQKPPFLQRNYSLVFEVYRAAEYEGHRIRSTLEEIFNNALLSDDSETRAKFFDLYRAALPTSTHDRLQYVLNVQCWFLVYDKN
ncbi:MAG: uncharacterized protein A8A55_1942, partial [Amphiamblys sp. WSBS2006]